MNRTLRCVFGGCDFRLRNGFYICRRCGGTTHSSQEMLTMTQPTTVPSLLLFVVCSLAVALLSAGFASVVFRPLATLVGWD